MRAGPCEQKYIFGIAGGRRQTDSVGPALSGPGEAKKSAGEDAAARGAGAPPHGSRA